MIRDFSNQTGYASSMRLGTRWDCQGIGGNYLINPRRESYESLDKIKRQNEHYSSQARRENVPWMTWNISTHNVKMLKKINSKRMSQVSIKGNHHSDPLVKSIIAWARSKIFAKIICRPIDSECIIYHNSPKMVNTRQGVEWIATETFSWSNNFNEFNNYTATPTGSNI